MNPLTKPTTSIDDLPPEMISELFKHLDVKDLVACSLVNKRWHWVYAAFKLNRLAAIDYDRNGNVINKWYDSNRPIQKADRCSSAMFLRWAEKSLLSNLRQLALETHKFEFDLNKLNRFQHLVHIEISIISSGEMTVNLNLPELKVLALHGWDDCHPLVIDCPLLNTLLYDGEGMTLFEVKQPKTIRKLDIGMFGPHLTPFKNVECLVTKKWAAISKGTLLSLPRLRELRYIDNIEWVFEEESEHGVGTLDRVKLRLSEFLGDLKQLRRRDFRFSFCGFQLTKTMLDEINFCVEVDEEMGDQWVDSQCVYMVNYHLIEPGALEFVSEVDYSLLLSCVTGEFPRCFPQKFTGIETVDAKTKVQDPDHFLWFLNSLRSLKSLGLIDTGLNQEFYNQLPASARSLTKLYLGGRYCENELNFEFIEKFSLEHLQIHPPLSWESLPSLFRWLGGLEEGEFTVRLREVDFNIRKKRDSTKWKIMNAEQLAFETENSEEIVNFFQCEARDKSSNAGPASDQL